MLQRRLSPESVGMPFALLLPLQVRRTRASLWEGLRILGEPIMPIMSQPSSAAKTSLIYITVGALTDIWSGIWYIYLRQNPPENPHLWYFSYGFLLSGLALVIIGLGIGRIGRSARHAELPPEEVTGTVAQVDQSAAQRAPIIAPVNPALPINSAGTTLTNNGTVAAIPANGPVAAPPVRQTARIS